MAKSMPNTLVAVIGKDHDAEDILYRSLKEFPSDKVVLIFEQEHMAAAHRVRDRLSKFGIPVEFEKAANTGSLEEMFIKLKQIKEREKGKSVVINVDTDYKSSCLALSAAFVNGVQALGVLDNNLVAYPIMKFSYYAALSPQKLMMLKRIFEKGKYETMQSLSRELKSNLPLTVYHIKGTLKKPGLEEMGLVQTERHGRNIAISLTKLGELLMKGTIDYEVNTKTNAKARA
ncbi:hypothetical protein HYV82_05770 [Candidatus Woesearchaeota archaeon]|nr:hypothetical protein [Candidatus Woesearchaeota archaeon]